MRSLIFKSFVGGKCVIEPGVIFMGVRVPDGRYVRAGSVIREQGKADQFPAITKDYPPLKDMNAGVVHVNKSLAEEYLSTEG